MRDVTKVLEHHGVLITAEELERWQPIFQQYEEVLRTVRSIRADTDEPATVFYAAWNAEA
jgi:hypothetical protein